MNRTEIRSRFRQENPEITERVLTDTVLNSWLIEGNLNFACIALLIQKSGSFSSVIGTDTYDLTALLADFYEVDEFPGGGVAYNDKRLTPVTKAELDNKSYSWRINANGTPKKYFRRANNIVFERPADAVKTIDIDYAAIPESFDDDGKTPFNGLTYLAPYHYGLVLYLQGRAKMAVSKDADKSRAMVEYTAYATWCKKQLQGGKIGKIQFFNADASGIGNMRSIR